MNCRTSPQKLARSYATNTFWDTTQVIDHTMLDGERSRSRCAPPRDFRLSASTQKQATTRPASRLRYSHVQFLFGIVCGVHSSRSARLQNVTKHSAESRMLYTILEESFWLPSKPATSAPASPSSFLRTAARGPVTGGGPGNERASKGRPRRTAPTGCESRQPYPRQPR